MKGLDWGSLYDEFKGQVIDTTKLELDIQRLMMDDDVTNKKGIYYYVLNHKEKYLNIRSFTPSQRRTVYERQGGKCNKCSKHFDFENMQADHIRPWSDGGHTELGNCQILCADCNRRKSNI